ncbi:hypothetical protein Cycma_3713 [Cyclobacterium marinum DSM 745]|uniref:Glycosyltransferase RgtA/B/C/D-like domain-containing protein n=2 Tax=Cyclobacterium marinum TaxID=104 RepID=G0J2T8_CYCMS|nr:hypothetical protein Cycma_3713 [Cyclobacterium marinum DSM 745]
MIDIFIILLLLTLIYKSNITFSQKYRIPNKYLYHLHYLLAYHVFFSLFYGWYIINFGGDSRGYWLFTMEQVKIADPTWMKYFGEGTTFILWLTYIPSKVLGLSYHTGNLLFGFLGFIGIRYIFLLVYKYFPTNHEILGVPLFPTVFYIANLHFWTSGVGKDALAFWAIAWFLFSIQQYKEKWWQASIAFFFIYMCRPHMGQALIGGAAIAILLGTDIKRVYKFGLAALALIGSIYMSSYTLDALKLESFDLETLEAFSASKSGNLNTSHVGSGVNISSYSWPMKLFTYLFRPLFFDAHNIVSFISSFENLLYLWLSLFIYKNWSPEALRDMPLFLKAGMVTFIPVTLAFMNALSNLGIAMRMKNMLMIYFLLFCFYLITHKKYTLYLRSLDRKKFFQRRQAIIDAKKKNAI